MRRASNEIARLIETALSDLRIPADRILNQLAGSQVAPPTTTTRGAVAWSASTPAANTNAGTAGSAATAARSDHAHPTGLTVKEVDAAPTVGNVVSLTVPNGSLTDDGSGAVTLAFAAGAITGVLSPANGGTGVNNGTNALTVPATGTAALLATANEFTLGQIVTVALGGAPAVEALRLRTTSSEGVAILATNPSGVTGDYLTILPNATYSGGAYNRIDTTYAAGRWTMGPAGAFTVDHVAAGANPIAAWTNLLTLTTAGNLTIAGTLTVGANTLTVPATGTAALGTGTATQVAYWSGTNTLAGDAGMTYTAASDLLAVGAANVGSILRVPLTSGTTGYGIRLWDGANEFANWQALDTGTASLIFFSTNRYYDGTNWQQMNTRVGGDLQISGDSLRYLTFPASSSTPALVFTAGATGIGFFGTAETAKQTVSGSRGGNAALASLLTALANYGLITNSSSA